MSSRDIILSVGMLYLVDKIKIQPKVDTTVILDTSSLVFRSRTPESVRNNSLHLRQLAVISIAHDNPQSSYCVCFGK